MNERLRRIGVITLLAAMSLGCPVAADQATPFRASGTDQITFFRGTVAEGISSGIAQPGGPFTAVWSGKVIGHAAVGVEIWDFGGGDTLNFAWQMLFDKGAATGTYVIIGGTGRFQGATGSAAYRRIGHGDGTGEFVLEGTISR